MKKLSITPKLTLAFLFFAGILMLGLSVPAYLNGREALRNAAISERLSTALEKQTTLDTWIRDRKHRIEEISRLRNIQEHSLKLVKARPSSQEALDAHTILILDLQEFSGEGHPFLDLHLIDAQTGQVVASTVAAEEGKYKEDRPYFINGLQSAYVQNPYFNLSQAGIKMTAAAPIFSNNGRVVAVLAGTLNMDEVNEIIRRRSGLRQSDDAFLVNTNKFFVTQPHLITDPAVLLRGINTLAVDHCLAQNSGVLEADDYRGVPAIIVYRWLPERQLCLISKIDQQEAYAPVRALALSMALTGGLVLLIGAFAAFSLSQSITKPIRELVQGVKLLGQGQLDTQISIKSGDEIGQLGREFNQMAASIAEKEGRLRTWADELELKVAQRTTELSASEERYRILSETSPDMIFVIDREDLVQYVNNRAAKQFGKTSEQVIGKARTELFPPAIAEKQGFGLRQVFNTGELLSSESLISFPEGQRWLDTQLVPMRDEAGQVSAVMGVSRDITERKRVETVIREEKALSESIINSLPGIFYLFDAQGKFLRWNRNFENLSGYSGEEMLERHPLEFFAGEDKTLIQERIQETFIKGDSQVEANFLSKNGGSTPYLLTGVRVQIEGDNYLIGTGIDITERRQAEDVSQTRLRILEYSTEHSVAEVLQNTLDEVGVLVNSPIGFYHFVDSDQETLTLQAWSTQTLEEYCETEGFGAHYPIAEAGVWVDCVHERRPVVHNDYLSLAHRKGLPEGHASLTRELVVPIFRKNSIVAILGVGNKPGDYTELDVELVTFFADLAWTIVERKQAEDSLQTAKDYLEKASKDLIRSNDELERFAYVASHDLQEPLRMVTSYLQLLERRYKDKLDGDALEFINYAVDGSIRMKTLISDLLAYSRVGTRGKEFFRIDCEEVLMNVLHDLQLSIEEAGANVTHDPLPEVMADAVQLGSLFQNLVNNAIKFRSETPPQIHFGVEVDEKEWIFSVSDNGIGVDPQYFERIFIIFQRLHNRENYAGTGIGLAISKRIVERHGGRIWIESQPDKGSTFFFTLPKIGEMK